MRQCLRRLLVLSTALALTAGCLSCADGDDLGTPTTTTDTSVADGSTTTAAGSPTTTTPCPPGRTWSVARIWNEALLSAIRLDLPSPVVHARNLFHVSAAMWDAWAAYEPGAAGYFVDEDHTADNAGDARTTAISHAAYVVLRERYSRSVQADATLAALDDTMRSLCQTLDTDDVEGDSPEALGNRIGHTVLEATIDDGSNEAEGYVDPTYSPVNIPLVVADEGTIMVDPNRWQPLEIANAIDQGGNDAPSLQTFIGSHWGSVTGFALESDARGLPLDPGPPPQLGDPETDDEFKDSAVQIIEFSSRLDPTDGVSIDISPAALGDNPLGTDDGDGYDVNPVTGEPYEPNVVARGDFGRVVAEFWADGPASETPPGHWNTIANDVSDDADLELRIGGDGPEVDRLEWDVKLYLALNGAVHDAAIAAWGAKRHYDYARPISMIRHMGGLGQSSDPEADAYDPSGLPLVDGVVEVITAASSAPGERHQHLAPFVGQIAVRSWSTRALDGRVGVGWILPSVWSTYQRQSFVTPAFAGYVSGHSTFSRAAAEVLTAMTGSPFFPGGLGSHSMFAGDLEFEYGPTAGFDLQWATYYDAADQAGISRLYGGIHVRADDLAGRRMGSTLGTAAWQLANEYYDAG